MVDASDLTPYQPTLKERARYRLEAARYQFGANWRRFCDRMKWISHKPGNLEAHARRELELAGWFDKDGFYGPMMGEAVLRMVRDFSQEGHSGMSAAIAVNLFQRVARFEPLTPLTGADDEWNEVGKGCWQNKRASNVFKNADGNAYDIEGRVFREPSGATYTSRDSRVPVTFPYTPTRMFVDVPGPEDAP